MKSILVLLTGVMFVMLLTSVSFGETTSATGDKDAPEASVLKNQTLCPVMGGKIDSTVYTDIQGQRVYHCCPGCAKSLKADPDKYFKKAAKDNILFENIQTTCPVTGKVIKEKTAFVDFEGRRVYFCCAMCSGKFDKAPQKYLSVLDEAIKTEGASKTGSNN